MMRGEEHIRADDVYLNSGRQSPVEVLKEHPKSRATAFDETAAGSCLIRADEKAHDSRTQRTSRHSTVTRRPLARQLRARHRSSMARVTVVCLIG